MTQNDIFECVRNNTNYLDFAIPIDIKMRTTPTVFGTGWGSYLTNGFTLSVASSGYNQILLRATKSNHGTANPDSMVIMNKYSGFSAEL